MRELSALLCMVAVDAPADPAPEAVAYFESNVRPLLIKHCYECHSGDVSEAKARLVLDHAGGWRRGGESGPALIPGKPESSRLMEAVRYANSDLQMPPKYRLNESDVKVLRRWIADGAVDPRDEVPDQGGQARQEVDIVQGKSFWAFRPPATPKVPDVRNREWPAGNIDRFILARLEEEQVFPAPDAEKRTLLRRAYFDLVGLPPTPDELREFIDSPAEEAFAAVVDELLARPEFGERWGRHWLDVARFAESSGGGRSLMFPHAWRFRDYVINAFNADKPFDQLIREHLAGDLLPWQSDVQRNEQLVGSGYLVLGAINYELQDKELLRMETIDEQVSAMGRSFLGMTLDCARCHDHKFDPIPTEDYYALAGIFGSTKSLVPGNVSSYVTQKLKVETPPDVIEFRNEMDSLRKALEEARERGEDQKVKRLGAELKRKEKEGKAFKDPLAMSVKDAESPEDGHVHIRGGVRNKGDKVARGVISVAMPAGTSAALAIGEGDSGRRELAEWVASPENPLTARVMANRIWLHLMGEGIVRTPDNFGATGERPSHPELLDYLARRYVQLGWSTKKLIREIMLSRVYRLASNMPSPSTDQENRLFSRANRKRLEAEAIRDTMLTLSASLDPDRGGRTIHTISAYDLGYKFKTRRKSVYVPWFRNSMLDLFEVFDAPNPNLVIGRRPITNLPTQALYLMNSAFVREQAERMAARLLAENATLEEVYERILGRPPLAAELAATTDFFAGSDNEKESWTQLCQSLFACVDFRYLD